MRSLPGTSCSWARARSCWSTASCRDKESTSSFTSTWAGILLVVVVGAIVAARVVNGQALPTSTAIGPSALLLVLSGLGTVRVLLRMLRQSSATTYGLYLGLLLAAVQTAYAYLAFRASREPVPTFGRRSTPPAR